VFVLIVVSAVTLFVNSPQKNYGQPDLLSLQNKKGAITLVTTLEDGSIVYLSDDAKLDYPPRFEENIREVYLQGNALFDVNGNKERPFLVNTQNIQVEVLGTSFYIEMMGP
jgi:ferric-dicitrate binding protein FerR (iron transport regulator)